MAVRIILISGACGTGKTTIADLLANASPYTGAVHLHTDDFYQYIRKGYIAPWLETSDKQNETVIKAAAASAKVFSQGGYEVYVDGVIGPWFLKPWVELAQQGLDVRYIVLRPDEQTTLSRALARDKARALPALNPEAIRQVWQSLSDLGAYEANAVNTAGQTATQTVRHLHMLLEDSHFALTKQE